MATSRRLFIIATIILACAAVALTVTSLVTSFWVVATLYDPDGLFKTSEINYGLFVGHIGGERVVQVDMDLSMSCLFSENVCLMSCQTEDIAREKELCNLLHGPGDSVCPNVDGASNNITSSGNKFINAGLWVSSVLFLAVELLAGVLAAVFAVINTTTNPTKPIVGVLGLYVWNGIAGSCTFLVMILWGSQFAATLSDNIAYSETITGIFSSQGQASLGVSYWLLLIVLFLHVANQTLLGVRQYLLSREPPPPTIKMEENTDGVIFLY